MGFSSVFFNRRQDGSTYSTSTSSTNSTSMLLPAESERGYNAIVCVHGKSNPHESMCDPIFVRNSYAACNNNNTSHLPIATRLTGWCITSYHAELVYCGIQTVSSCCGNILRTKYYSSSILTNILCSNCKILINCLSVS